jgi:hypothetical protein
MGKRKEREPKDTSTIEDESPEYEKVRKKNIDRNREILSALDIEQVSVPAPHVGKPKSTKTKTKSDLSKKKEVAPISTASRRSVREKKEVVTYNDEELSREAEKPRAGSYIPPNSPAGMKVVLQSLPLHHNRVSV